MESAPPVVAVDGNYDENTTTEAGAEAFTGMGIYPRILIISNPKRTGRRRRKRRPRRLQQVQQQEEI